MFGFEDKSRVVYFKKLLEKMEDICTELRVEYLDMAQSFDGMQEMIEELESDNAYLEGLVEESRQSGGWE